MLFQIDFADVLMAFGILILLAIAFKLYQNDQRDRFAEYLDKVENFQKEQAALKVKPPLVWSKENGFNRAPTLDEALMFRVNDDGDMVRREMANGKSLDQALDQN